MTERLNGRSRLPWLVPVIAAFVLLADQLTKWAAVENLSGRGRVDVIDGVLWLHLTRNPGAAFSMATGATWLLTIVALIVVVAIIRVSRNLGSRGWALALGLLLGGALGNLGDRLFREPSFFHGQVIDFLEFPHWPIFNLADSSISTAAVLIALLSLRGIGIDGRPSNDNKVAASDGQAAGAAPASVAAEPSGESGEPAAEDSSEEEAEEKADDRAEVKAEERAERADRSGVPE